MAGHKATHATASGAVLSEDRTQPERRPLAHSAGLPPRPGGDVFGALVQNSRVGTVILTAVRDDDGQVEDFRHEYANPAAAELMRVDAETLLRATVREMFPESAEPETLEHLSEVLRTGVPRVLDAHPLTILIGGRRLAGRFDLRAYRLDDERLGVTIQEVTEAAETREHAQLLAAVVQSSDDAIMAKSLDGTILSWNPGAERLYGYAADEAIGRPVTILEPPERQGEIQGLLARLTADGHVDHYETVRIAKDGHRVDVSVTISPIRDERGAIVAATSVARDVTEQRRLRQRLNKERAYNRGLIEAARDGLVTVGPNLIITDVNEGLCRMSGRSRDDLVGSPFPEHFTDPGRAAAGVRLTLGEGSVTDYDLILRTRAGEEIMVSFNAATYLDPESRKVQGIFAAARDVTERKRAEHEVRRLNAELEQRVRSRTADLERSNSNLEGFAYSVSHDLRAPLRAMSGFSDILLRDYTDMLDPTGRNYAERISGAAQRMTTMIDDLLQLSRVSRSELKREPVDLSELARTIVADLRAQEPGREVTFTVQDGLSAVADPAMMRKLLENLLGNAWKFTSHRPSARIEFGALEGDASGEHEHRGEGRAGDSGEGHGEVVYFVRDDGAGFDEEFSAKLFVPFQRLHSAREYPGTGVGLANVQRIVERHGGRCWAHGKVGQGATFYFTIPAP